MAKAVRVNGVHQLKEHAPNPDRRDKIGRILANLGKFTVDSAVNDSRKFVTGVKKVYQIVQEGLKEQPVSLSPNNEKKPDDLKLVEDIQARIEETHEDMNKLKQQSKTSAKLIERSDPSKKKPNEGIKEPDLLKTKGKKIFIRSRL